MLSLKNLIIIQTPEDLLNKFKDYPLLLKNDINDIVWKVYKFYYQGWDIDDFLYTSIHNYDEVILYFYSHDNAYECEFIFKVWFINQILNQFNKN